MEESPLSVSFRRASASDTGEVRDLVARSMAHWERPPGYLAEAGRLMSLGGGFAAG